MLRLGRTLSEILPSCQQLELSMGMTVKVRGPWSAELVEMIRDVPLLLQLIHWRSLRGWLALRIASLR